MHNDDPTTVQIITACRHAHA